LYTTAFPTTPTTYITADIIIALATCSPTFSPFPSFTTISASEAERK